MGKPFLGGRQRKKKKKLQTGQCKLLKTTMVHFTDVDITLQYRGIHDRPLGLGFSLS
jgi:hypothetical protein